MDTLATLFIVPHLIMVVPTCTDQKPQPYLQELTLQRHLSLTCMYLFTPSTRLRRCPCLTVMLFPELSKWFVEPSIKTGDGFVELDDLAILPVFSQLSYQFSWNSGTPTGTPRKIFLHDNKTCNMPGKHDFHGFIGGDRLTILN